MFLPASVIFDFDDTLTDESTTKLLDQYGIDTRAFWKRHEEVICAGWDTPLAYLQMILEHVGPGRALGNLSNAALNSFGSTLDFYKGVPDLFADLEAITKQHHVSRPTVEFYIVSSGLEQIIKGTSIANYFSGIWGCRFSEESGQIAHVMRAVSPTEKTKYLSAINKGVSNIDTNPLAVNEKIPDKNRRIPFSNMIYIGDGFSDVPCFSLVRRRGGTAFGVFDPSKDGAPKKAWEKLVIPHRVSTMNSPRYGAGDDLGALLREAIKTRCIQMDAHCSVFLNAA